MGKAVELVNGLFGRAHDSKSYRKALSALKRLHAKDQLLCLDALFAAAERLGVERTTGYYLNRGEHLPRVVPRGSVVVGGREVVVEELG